jgi:hypothetical protein
MDTRGRSDGLGGWHADAAGEGSQPGKGLAAAGAKKIFGHPVDRRPVADLSGSGAFG